MTVEKKDIDWGSLGFGYMKTDYSYEAHWKDGEWDEGGLTTDHTLHVSECGGIFHYCQEVFEGLKAYTAEDGSKQRPIMIHRVCFGSIERFIGILTEHYAGKFPVWLAPTQVKVLPVSEKSMEYSKKVYDAIRISGIRTELDERNEKIGYKIREAQQVERVPYMLVIGAKEVEAGNVTVRNRDTGESTTMGLDEFIAKVQQETKDRV